MDNKKKNSQIKLIEEHLRKYNTYKVGVITLQNQLDYIMPSMTASYDLAEGSSGTFNIKSDTENFAIDRIESKKALIIHEDMERYNMIIDSIDRAMNELDELEKEFVELRYIERNTIQKTSHELGYNEKYIFNIRNQIFDKFLISLKGLIHF